MPRKPDTSPAAPGHLRPETAQWVEDVLRAYLLEDHHRRLLTLAAESWDRCTEAREALAIHGLTFVDRFNQPHARPEVGIERDCRIGFARLLRELDLDVEPPPPPARIAALRSNRR